jgi:hypothetical protein
MKNLLKNQKVLQGLPSLQQQGYKHAYLVAEDDANIPEDKKVKPDPKTVKKAVKEKINTGSSVFEFLYNPESVSISTPINYQETTIPYTVSPQMSYVSGGAQTLTISDIYLDTYFEKKSLQPLLDRLTKLREPSRKRGLIFSPPTLFFKWGEYRSFPCVLTQLDYVITNRINGYPVRAKLNLTFREVPAKISELSSVSVIATPGLAKPLTTKQIIDAAKEATTRYRVEKNQKVSVNSHTGSITVASNVGTTEIGTYNGDVFKPNDVKISKNFNLS